MPKRLNDKVKERIDRRKAVEMLREQAEQIYDALATMRDIIRHMAPDELERAEAYWLGHIDGALENRKGYVGGSFISFEDTIKALQEE